MILTPDMSKGIECYVVADFAGNWHLEDTEDRHSLLLRTWFIILFWECPITQVSKLQTKVALLTTEADYIASSYLMMKLIPIRNLAGKF